MSTQHMPTPANNSAKLFPLFVVQNGKRTDLHYRDTDQSREFTVAQNVQRDYAVHIVRCVNSHDELNNNLGTAIATIATLTTQRDALVAALRNFRAWYADHFEDFSTDTNAQLLCLDNEADAALKAATE
jgi:hypothetical protein